MTDHAYRWLLTTIAVFVFVPYRDKARVETTWKIPESWGSCRVIVFGDPGMSFDLLEWPTGPAEP